VVDRLEAIDKLAEVFREHGYEGASLALMSKASGLGKGSLYHLFPGGKDEMADAVLGHVSGWFEEQVFMALRSELAPRDAIALMIERIDTYFRSGRRTCLVGIFALSDARDRFSCITTYFTVWQQTLAQTLVRGGQPGKDAEAAAEDAIAGIQGALVTACAIDDPDLFCRVLRRIERRLVEQCATHVD
jgi:TetR/AcrR family transcriptional repressor of lmrAB and yxaGH operons